MAFRKKSSKKVLQKPSQRNSVECLPKIIGYDGEVCNFITGLNLPDGTGKPASQAILSEFDGIRASKVQQVSGFYSTPVWINPRANYSAGYSNYSYNQHFDDYEDSYNSQDFSTNSQSNIDDSINQTGVTNPTVSDYGYNVRDIGRKFLSSTGGCVYIDLDHVELCLPEVICAFDHVACWHAMIRHLRLALDKANSKQPQGQKIHVLLNNSDGKNHSYGTHINFLITENCRKNIMEKKMKYLLYLASYQVSSIIFTGQGKVGSENGAPEVDFQLSQRADFMEQLISPHTTFSRPVINSRNESLCGSAFNRIQSHYEPNLARLHVIFYDSTLCHVSSLLKVGVMQIILAMMEAGYIDSNLILEDPLQALHDWSHDLTFQETSQLWSEGSITALQLQYLFLEKAIQFVESGRCEGIVPRASDIIDLWSSTLDMIRDQDLHALSRRLDWALKLSIIDGILEENPQLNWQHPSIKLIDHIYSNIDLKDGLYWSFESNGAVESVVEESRIEHFLSNPPEDTRAWTRAMLLRKFGSDRIESIDWDQIRFADDQNKGYQHFSSTSERTIHLANPLAYTKVLIRNIIESSSSPEDIIKALNPAGIVKE